MTTSPTVDSDVRRNSESDSRGGGTVTRTPLAAFASVSSFNLWTKLKPTAGENFATITRDV